MSSKTITIAYRVATILLALFILPGLFFMNSEMAIEGMKHVLLSEPVWLQQLLGWASPVAILTILGADYIATPLAIRLKEWAYAGLSFVYLGAFWAHFSLGHPISEVIMPIVVFAILMVSYFAWHKKK